MIVDELRIANWQRTGKKGAPRPKRISPLAKRPGTQYGRTDRSPAEVATYLDRFAPRAA